MSPVQILVLLLIGAALLLAVLDWAGVPRRLLAPSVVCLAVAALVSALAG